MSSRVIFYALIEVPVFLFGSTVAFGIAYLRTSSERLILPLLVSGTVFLFCLAGLASAFVVALFALARDARPPRKDDTPTEEIPVIGPNEPSSNVRPMRSRGMG